MYKIFAKASPVMPIADARKRSRWISVLASGITLVATASAFLGSETLIASLPVHAYSKQSRQAGTEVFKTKGCEHCHGIEAVGTDRGPELQDIGRRWKKDRIEQQIRNGGGGMPPFGDALQPDEVKDLVDYLSAMRKRIKPMNPVKPAPSGATNNPDDSGV